MKITSQKGQTGEVLTARTCYLWQLCARYMKNALVSANQKRLIIIFCVCIITLDIQLYEIIIFARVRKF